MKSLLSVSCIFLFAHAWGQQRVHFNITQQQGLPSNTVYSIFQDSRGFLWVATENGLARYNGAFFRRYNNTEVRATAVSNVTEDATGTLWLHNFFGEILYVENDTLKKLNSWEDKYSDGFPNVTNLGDSLLISSAEHLYYYKLSSGEWDRIDKFETEKINYNHHLVTKGVQWLCYATPTHTVVRSINNPRLPVYELAKSKYKANNNVVRLLEWRNKLWLFDAIAKSLLQLSEGVVTDLSAKYKQELINCRQVQNIGDSILAFTGTNGAYLFKENGEKLHLLPSKNVSHLTADREGGLWLGTLNEGLFYVPASFSILYPKEHYGLFTKLAEDRKENRIVAGGYTGDAVVFSADGKTQNILKSEFPKEVQALFVDTISRELFVYRNSLKSYDLTTLKQTQEYPIAAVKEIVRVNEKLALATSAGLYLLEPITGKYSVLFNHQRITSVTFDKQKQVIWVGAQKGIFTYNLTTSTWQPWKDEAGFSPGASRLRVLDSGNVLIGTLTNGLYIVDEDSIRHLTINSGLPSNRITALAVDGHTIWIGTENGITSIDRRTQKIAMLNRSKGLAAAEVRDMQLLKGNLWVSNAAGLQVFNTHFSNNSEQPRIYLQQVKSGSQQIVVTNSKIALDPASQQLSLEFDISNSLRSQGHARILYRIVELDKENWNSITLQNPIVNYASLPYGSLTFEAKAVNEDGIESSNQIQLVLNVKAPFWKQLWFVSLMLLLSTVAIVIGIYVRLKKAEQENRQKLQQLNQEQEVRIAQLTSIRAQMNPHFIFNTMSLIQGKVLKGLLDDANRNLQNFSVLLRKVLDFSGKEMIMLQEEIEVLEKYLAIEKDRFDDELEYSIAVNDAVEEEMIRIPSLLTQPFVENALRHGLMHKQGKKILTVRFHLADSILTITIDDNGIGRIASAEFNKARRSEHTSFAMSAYQKRIDILNAMRKQKIRLEIIDKHNTHGMASGTTVVITLPLNGD